MSRTTLLGLAAAALLAAGCRQDMHDQPRYEPLERSSFFADERASRPQVEGTVARGAPDADALLVTGREGGELSARYPFPVDREVLLRGQERYDIFCSPCHDRVGNGLGMIVQRGMKRPASFHTERLRAMPPGYFFDVITNGFGAMFDYSDRIPPEDRWAIAAWVQTLQMSQNMPVAALPEGARAELEGAGGTR